MLLYEICVLMISACMYNIHKYRVQEKALRDATDTGARDLVEALSQLDEMVGHCIYMRSKTAHVT